MADAPHLPQRSDRTAIGRNSTGGYIIKKIARLMGRPIGMPAKPPSSPVRLHLGNIATPKKRLAPNDRWKETSEGENNKR